MVYLKAEDMLAAWSPETLGFKRFWTPTARDGEAAYQALQTYLRTPDVGLGGWAETARQEVSKNLRTYSFRITGITLSSVNGAPEREVVNLEGVCEAAAEQANWRNPGFVAMDGGACFFDAFYDPTSKAIIGFQPHGLA